METPLNSQSTHQRILDASKCDAQSETEKTKDSVAATVEGIADMTTHKRGFDFWMVFVACLVCDLLSALDLTAVSTVLPTIVDHLHGDGIVWAGSAYTIAATAVLPLVGGLASIFGRRPILLTFIVVFAIGSAISGAAQSINMLIVGRAIQGFGGGGCLSTTEIIYADMVPLAERGKFFGVTASIWAFACAIGPVIGGGLANAGSWRWLFFLNLPLCGVAFVLEFFFLRVHTPKDPFRLKIVRMDWFGNSILIGSTVSVLIALAWAGQQFSWSSAQVLAPLIIGVIGIIAFFFIERFCSWIREPTIPWYIITHRTTLSGYLGTFFHGVASIAVIYYLPIYFQASKGASPIRSGVYFFGTVIILAPVAMLTGVSVQIVNKYRPQNYLGWVITVVGFGLLTILDENSSRAQYIGLQVLLAIGLGMIWIATQFPILAPLPFSNNAHALAFFTFVRCFAQSWGIVIGGTILQNTLKTRIPASVVASLPKGSDIAYSIIPTINSLPEPLRIQVRTAFADGTRRIWQVMAGISGAGLISCFLMSEEVMRKDMDGTWGLKEREKASIAASSAENGSECA